MPKCLLHLVFNPLVIGGAAAASATVGVILTPLAAAAVGVVSFGAAGPVAGEPHSSPLELSPAHT